MTIPLIPQKAPICQDVEPGTYWWCACGKSKTQPFCDGSHQGTGFLPVEVVIPEPESIAWCACKHTKTQPFCDGTHNSL